MVLDSLGATESYSFSCFCGRSSETAQKPECAKRPTVCPAAYAVVDGSFTRIALQEGNSFICTF